MVRLKVQLSTIFRWMIFAAVFVLGEFIYIVFPSAMATNATIILFSIGALGVLSAALVIILQQKRIIPSEGSMLAKKYLAIYTLIMLFMMLYTVLNYGYTVRQAMTAITPYLYVYYSMPLIYIYGRDNTQLAIVNKIKSIVIFMLCIKTVCWFLYNFTGTVLFEKLIFRFGDGWVRDGLLRIDPGCLFGIAFSVVFSYSCIYKKNFKYKVIAALMLCFVVFISQFRYQIISIIVVAIVGLYASSNNRTARRNKLLLGCIGVFLFVALGGASTMFSSFSVAGENGSSTLARLNTMTHYWDLMRDQKAIFGLGLLNSDNPVCYTMMAYVTLWGEQAWYYLEDVGILGGFFRFGILAVPLYGLLFAYAIKAYKMCRKKGNREFCVLLACVGSYLIFSNMVLNMFDGQRAFAVPFYLSIISYCHGVCLDEPESSEIR